MDTNINLALKVSILMCTYNRAEYLPQAIESVLAQDFSDYELIVMDDASTDGAENLIKKYTADARVRYIRNPSNLGLGGNRAAALSQATGEYVAILDSDDYWNDNTKLSKQVAYLKNHPNTVIVGTFGTAIDSDGKVLKKMYFQTEDRKIRSCILSYHQFLHSSVLYRRDVAIAAGGYVPTLAPAEDYDLILKMGAAGAFANIPNYSTCYRVHSGNTSSGQRNSKVRHAKLHLEVIKTSGRIYPNKILATTKAYLRIAKSYLNL